MKRCYGCMRIKESSPHCEHCGFDERTENNSHQLPLGTEVGGQYILGRVLGQGGFGITYLGWDTITEQTVAVKEYFPSGFAGRNTNTMAVTSYDGQDKNTFESNKKRFLREAEALGKLWNIPQIVKVLRCFEENGTVYIAMEYVDGCDLRKYMKRLGRPMTMDETLSILGPIIEALSHVHRAELVHRDISPDNIMVLPDGSAKLLDFGAARYVENADAEKERVTSTQAILKHGFAPPEQYQSHGALGPWTDVYAICATVYYCLTGKVPPEAMSRMIERRPLQLDTIPGLTPRQRAVLEKGMALTPKDRYPSARELWDKLAVKKKKAQEKDAPTREEASPKETPIADAPGSEQSKRFKSRDGTDFMIASLFIALILLVGIGVFLIRKPAVEKPVVRESIPETATETAPRPTEAPLEIASSLDLTGVDLGHTEAIPILSEHDAAEIQWTSSDPGIAPVSEEGVVTAQGFGTVQITAQYQDQQTVCTVSVDLKANVTCTFEVNETGLTITGYEEDKEDLPEMVILPREKDGRPVTAIDESLFSHCDIIGIIIPDGVASIPSMVFYGCNNLSDIRIPDSVTKIGSHAFFACSKLQSIVIPYGVTQIDSEAFENCSNLESIEFPNSLTSIGESAFLRCKKLKRLILPDSVTSIGNYAFKWCTGIEELTLSKGLTTLGFEVFSGCESIKEVIIPSGVTRIDGYSFHGCTMMSRLEIPNSVTYIKDYAFYGCSNLDDVKIPDSVAFIGANSFGETAWYESLDDEFVVCGDHILLRYGGSESEIIIPNTIKMIAGYAFSRNTTLKSVVLPQSVTYIGSYAFNGCSNLTNVTIPDSVTSIGSSAFNECGSLSSIIIPDSVTSIGFYAFHDCRRLNSVTISENCEVGYSAFPDTCTINRR